MKSFLIVDDDAAILKLNEALITAKYGDVLVTSALNGREALEKARSLDYTVILTDLKMPVMNGAEFYRKLKDENPTMAERLGVISGNPESDRDISYLRKEGRPSLTKPVRNADFYDLIDSILDAEVEKFKKAHGYRCMRKFARFSEREKCTIRPLSSEFSASKPTIANTADYSENGIGIRYEGRYIPSGSEVMATIFSLGIANKIGKVVWSRPCDGGFKSGLLWL